MLKAPQATLLSSVFFLRGVRPVSVPLSVGAGSSRPLVAFSMRRVLALAHTGIDTNRLGRFYTNNNILFPIKNDLCSYQGEIKSPFVHTVRLI